MFQKHQKSASIEEWMTYQLFKDEIRYWDDQLNKVDRKIVLLEENCTAHFDITVLKK